MGKRINAVVTDEKFNFIESVSKGNRSFVISEGLEALSLMIKLFGKDWITEARDAANALIIIKNQYDSVEAAMAEHSGLFKDGE